MKEHLLIALFILPCLANASESIPSCTPSATEIVVGKGTIMDCSATTDDDTRKPFHDLLYEHYVYDPNAGVWQNGARKGMLKNYMTGPIAAYVFENAGTFEWKSCTHDGETQACVKNTINVMSQDARWPTISTTCLFNKTVGIGCPSKAKKAPATSEFADVMACIGANKRCLLKRGDVFTRTAVGTITASGAQMIGAYGPSTSPNPIVVGTNVTNFSISGSSVNDLLISDLDIRGSSGSTDKGKCLTYSGWHSNITVSRVSCTNMGGLFSGSGAQRSANITNLILYENYVDKGGGMGFQHVQTGAAMGNYVGDLIRSTGEHSWRVQHWQKYAITDNTIKGPECCNKRNSGKHNLTMRGWVAQSKTRIVGAADNGDGAIRLKVKAHTTALKTGDIAAVSGVDGTNEANGIWAITVIDSTHVDLQGSKFLNAYVNPGSEAEKGLMVGPDNGAEWDSFYGYVAHNIFDASSPAKGGTPVEIAPSSDTQSHRLYDLIFEANYIKIGPGDGPGRSTSGVLVGSSQRITVRNNIIDGSLKDPTTGGASISVQASANSVSGGISDAQILNNTNYGTQPSQAGVSVSDNIYNAIVTVTVKNNLCYYPNRKSYVNNLCVNSRALRVGRIILGGNTPEISATCDQTSDPLFEDGTGSLSIALDFRLKSESCAVNSGTTLGVQYPAFGNDFLGCFNKTGNIQTGAIIPRAHAQCRNVTVYDD